MKKRINLRLILIAGIAVIVTMVCMTGIYYKLFQGCLLYTSDAADE